MRDDGEQAGSADKIAKQSRQDKAAGCGDGRSLPGQHQQPGFRGTCDYVAEPADSDHVRDDKDDPELTAACVWQCPGD